MYFSCLDELLAKLENVSTSSKINKKINLIGYRIKVHKSDTEYDMLDIYTETYTSLINDWPNFTNIHQLYLELYQQNKEQISQQTRVLTKCKKILKSRKDILNQ
jgi:hypothetical protein